MARQIYDDPVQRLVMNSVALHSGCWVWMGSYNNVGRPRIAVRINGKAQWITVARYVAQFVHGQRWGKNKSRRKVGAHSCDNGQCCNPEHIKPSTQLRNVRECVERGRHGSTGFRVPSGAFAGKRMRVQ